MALSRIAALVLIALLATAAAQDPDTTETAYRTTFPIIAELDCPRGQSDDDIVVCGRRDGESPYRLPLPVEPEPGARVAGEAPSAVTAMGTREKCSTSGPNQNCGGGLPVFAIAATLVKLVEKAIDPEE